MARRPSSPDRHWISNLPATTPVEGLVRSAKRHWCIEHGYRELRHGMGLDHLRTPPHPKQTQSRNLTRHCWTVSG
ncbi:hypothetical protein ADK37_38250 [Streptomyces resistomycificus]|uniref:Transposase IS4-like domain-containing protein n=1 Tax=Streptomyces resistomycificus TaxID=67356 RepID=A0A0L8KT47_9ACTN|nr:hypothetical protein ADK37_38250 [Streptomyces resistomycificus]